MTARMMGPALPASGDALTRYPEDLASIGQPNYTEASALAETRLWGSDAHTFAPLGTRRTLAVGYAGRQGIMLADGPHPDLPTVKGYNFYPAR